MSLSLLPRGVAAKRASAQGSQEEPDKMQLDISTSSPPTSHGNEISPTQPKATPRWRTRDSQQPVKTTLYERKLPKPVDPRHLAILIETSMSDYALWKNRDLRRYAGDKSTNGFIHLSRLFNESPLLRETGHDFSETAVLQALKEHGTGFIELQMRVLSSRKQYRGSINGSTYNIRRIDWETLRGKKDALGSSSQHNIDGSFWERDVSYWNDRTVYIENIPRKYWPLPAAIYFVHSLTRKSYEAGETRMTADGASNSPSSHVQHLELPAHEKASPGDVPVGKGFAFVTFRDIETADACLHDWPWVKHAENATRGTRELMQFSGDKDPDGGDNDGPLDEMMNLDLSQERDEHQEAAREATQSGFRSISLAQWEELKTEYLERQSALYEANKPVAPPASAVVRIGKEGQKQLQEPETSNPSTQVHDLPPHLIVRGKGPSSHPSETTSVSSFPDACLIFVKNLHPQTNKTALKALFGDVLKLALKQSNPHVSDRKEWSEIDYVDWQKGMSSAQMIIFYLSQHPRVHANGNDRWEQLRPMGVDQGVEGETRQMIAELVEGRAASIYWEKIPDKIRRTAVARLARLDEELKAMDQSSGEAGLHTSEDVAKTSSDQEATLQEREKKRRRKA